MGSRKLGSRTGAGEATGSCPNQDGSSARKTAASQAATGRSGNRGLSGSFDLCDQCATKRARSEGLQNALVGESDHSGNNTSSWWVLTDWPVQDEQSAVRIFMMYRERWAAEDSFKVTKECLGWEEVQVLDWQALQTLVALAWVTAGFLYHMGVTFQWEEVQLIAKLGGWEPHKDRKPGKITLMRGLRRLIDMLATQAVLSQYVTQHEELPPNITAFLQGWTPPKKL